MRPPQLVASFPSSNWHADAAFMEMDPEKSVRVLGLVLSGIYFGIMLVHALRH